MSIFDKSPDDEYDLLSQTLNKTFWQSLFGGSYVESTTVYENVSAVKIVEQTDFKTTSKLTCENLFIAESDYEVFKDFYDTATAKDEIVVLFRFDLSEFSSVETILGTTNSSSLNSPNIDVSNTNGYIFKQNIYLGFEVIHLEFENDKGKTIVPFVMSPQTIVNEVTPPLIVTPGTSSNFNFLSLMGIIAGLLLLLLFAPVLPYIIRFIVWLVLLPFRAIGALFGALFGRKNKKKKE